MIRELRQLLRGRDLNDNNSKLIKNKWIDLLLPTFSVIVLTLLFIGSVNLYQAYKNQKDFNAAVDQLKSTPGFAEQLQIFENDKKRKVMFVSDIKEIFDTVKRNIAYQDCQSIAQKFANDYKLKGDFPKTIDKLDPWGNPYKYDFKIQIIYSGQYEGVDTISVSIRQYL